MSDSDIKDTSFSKTTDPVERPPEMPTTEQHFSLAKHACDRCPKRFETKFLLNLHCVTRCPKLPYACARCELRFSNLSNFRSHQKICKKEPKEQPCSKTRMNQSVRSKEEDPGGSNSRKTQNIHSKPQLKKKDVMGRIAKGKQKESNEEGEPTVSNGKNLLSIQPKPIAGSNVKRPQKIYKKRPSEVHPAGSNARKRQSIYPKKAIKRQKTFVTEPNRDDPKDSHTGKNNELNMEVPKVERLRSLDFRKQEKLPEEDLPGSSEENPFDDDSEDSTDKGSGTKMREMVPSTCKICHLTFVSRRRLGRHMRVHSDKKAYQCDKCHLGFYWKSNYERHLKIKCSAGSLHECKKCFQLFTRKFSLLRHYQTRHAENEADLSVPKPDAVKEEDCNAVTGVKSEEDARDQSGGNSDEDDQDDSQEMDSGEGTQEESKGENSIPDERNSYKIKEISSNLHKIGNSDKQLVKNANVYQGPVLSKRQRKRKHTSRRYKCDICNLWFMWKCDLNRHRITHSNNKAYPCNECELGFNWKSNLTRHQKNVHSGEPAYRCDSCGEGFVKSHHLSRHYCSKRHTLRNRKLSRLRKRNELHNSVESNTLQSQTPNRVPQGEASDYPEVKNCTKSEQEVVIKAEPDSSSKTTPEEIRPDIDQHVNIVYLHVCQKGGYKTESSCENVQPACDVAPEATGSDLPPPDEIAKKPDIPIKVEGADVSTPNGKNEPQKEFVCSKCSRVFYRKTCHVQHERSHNRQPVKCPWCGREFVRKALFDKHVLVHTVEKPFSCDVCPAYFRLQSQLVTHLKSHTGQKPFECEFCSSRFSRASLLERHRRTHTGERPFRCEFCGLAFIQKCSLVLHQKVHVGEKPFRCIKCGVRFADKSSYERHVDRVHDGETAESFFRRKHQKPVLDHHIYNTRFAQRATEEDVDDPISRKKIKREGSVEDGSRDDKEFDVEYLESVDVRSKRRLSRNSNKGSAATTDEVSDYCEVIEEEVSSGQAPASKAVDPRRRENARNYASGVFVKKESSPRDVDSNKNESVNELTKSYKSKSVFKGMRNNRAWFHGAKTKGEMSKIREAMSALKHCKSEDRSTVESKKGKDAKSKTRRCSKEMEISEGLENFHIGPCKKIVFSINGSDNAPHEAAQTSKDDIFAKNHSYSENATEENSCETQQDGYIFQDIITVENPTTSVSLKCNEDFENRFEELSKNNKDQGPYLKCKSSNSVIVENGQRIQCDKFDEVAINLQKDNEGNLKYKETDQIYKSCEIADELNKREINQGDGNVIIAEEKIADCHQGSRGEIVNKIYENVKGNETGKYIETANIIRIRKCITSVKDSEQKIESSKSIQTSKCQMEIESQTTNKQMNLIEEQDTCNRLQMNLKETRDCHKSEGLSQSVLCDCRGQNQHEENILPDQVVESDKKICVCKDVDESEAVFIHENANTQVEADDNRIGNFNHETSESIHSLKKSILPVLEKDFKSEDETNFKPVENNADFEQIEETLMKIDRCQTEKSHQKEDCETNIEIHRRELKNGIQRKDTDVGNKENEDGLDMGKYQLFPDGSMQVENTLLEDEVVGNDYQCIEKSSIEDALNMHGDISTGDAESFGSINEIQIEEINDHISNIGVDKLHYCFEEASEGNKECINETYHDESNCIQENIIGTSSDTLYDGHNDGVNSNHNVDKRISIASLPNPNVESNGVNQNRRMIFKDSPERISNDKTGLVLEVPTDQEIISAPLHYDAKKCNDSKIKNGEETDSCSETAIKLESITNNDIAFHGAVDNAKTQTETPVMNGRDRSKEKQQSSIFHAAPSEEKPFQFRSVNPANKDNYFGQNHEGKLVCNAEPMTRRTVNNRIQDMLRYDPQSNQAGHDEIPTNYELTEDETSAGTSFEQNKKINVCFSNVDSEQSVQFPYKVYKHEPEVEMQMTQITNAGEMTIPFSGNGMEQNHVSILNVHSERNIQPAYEDNIDKRLSTRYETSEKPAQYREAQLGHYPGYQHFEMDSIKNITPHTLNNEDFETTLHKSDQTFRYHNQITQGHANGEVPNNYQVQCSTYEADIDEETIRYAVQTVQAIIQSEVPMSRETMQSVQAPVQYHGQEIIRYETQSFQVPFRYGSSAQRGYDVHTHPTDFHGMQASSNTQREIVQYDVSNIEFPFRYSYVDSQLPNMTTPVQSRNGSKVVHYKEACSSNYPTAYIKQDSIVYKGHEAIGFEGVFPSSKPLSDHIPVNRNIVPYEKAASGLSTVPNEVHPYESVEVSETVYTNLDMASYGNPSAVTYVPYKELFIDKGVVHKKQYSDAYSYSNASEKFYTLPVMRSAEIQQTKLSIDYEKSYSYADHQGKNFTFLQDSAANESESFTYQDLIPNGRPVQSRENELQISSVSSRVQKKIRKNRTEILDPNKTRVRSKRIDYVNQRSAGIDFLGRESANRRSSSDEDKNAFFDQASKFDHDINNSNNTSRMVSYDYPSIEMSQKSSGANDAEESFECDKCTRIFNRKNDLIRHRFTEHEKIRPSSSFSN